MNEPDAKSPSKKERNEMDRIARQAREFREQETKRIAAEKEAAKLVFEKEKQEERERVGMSSGQTLEEAAKFREEEEKTKSPTKKTLILEKANVSGKAKRLLEKEESERRWLEEDGKLVGERPRKSSTEAEVRARQAALERSFAEAAAKPQQLPAERARQEAAETKAAEAAARANKEATEKEVAERVRKGATEKEAIEAIERERKEAAEQEAIERERKEAAEQEAADRVRKSAAEKEAAETTLQPKPINIAPVEATTVSNKEVSTLDDKYVQSLVVRKFDQRSFPRKRKGKDKVDEDRILIDGSIRKEASFEIPVEFTENGFQLSKEAEVFMITSMPPSRVHGRWSGTLEGRSTLASSSSATGSFSLDYKSSRSTRLSFGMIRGHQVHYPLITIGGTLVRKGSSVGVTFYNNASFLHPRLLEHSMYSLSFRHLFADSRWIFTSELSRRQKLSLSLSSSKLAGSMGWNPRKPKEVKLRLDVRPKISEHRRAHLFCEWKLAGWQVGGSLVQSLGSQIASVGVGLRLISSRGLEWVFSWNRGDASIKIPIVLSRGLQSVHLSQLLYFSMVSFLIQEGVADIWDLNSAQSDEEPTKSLLESVETGAKARVDAELQRELMARQANRKKKEEAEKEGLVIHMATYQVEGGDEWDATIPLQFWVSRSSLSLPPTPKSQLLGFYDVTVDLTKKEESSTAASLPYWWSNVWNDLLDMAPKRATKSKASKGRCPNLTVRYDFQGQLYSITVKDLEELKLPNPRATRL